MRLRDEDAWELVQLLDLELDFEGYRDRLGRPIDLMLDDAPPSEVERAAKACVRHAWDEPLRVAVGEELDRLELDARVLLVRLAGAKDELERPVGSNRLARAVIDMITGELAAETSAAGERLDVLEQALAAVPPETRRPLVLPVAGEVAGAIGIPAAEAAEASDRFLESFPLDWREETEGATNAAHWLARTLGTDERRESMRERLGALVDVVEESLPLVAGELRQVLSEPFPEDPADDDLWVNLVVQLV